MLKKEVLSSIMLLFFISIEVVAQQVQWKPAGDKIKSKWVSEINPENVLPEYPRPIMKREEWKNLNGLWEYSIASRGKGKPKKMDGNILVPFAVESSLSGVMKTVGSNKELWYKTKFTIPENWHKKDIFLHFGAVDWKADVWLNDVKVGTHRGGFEPFTFNIAPFLNQNGSQQLSVKVWDPTDEGPQARGKQVQNPEGIWYTSVTGIWQTVWLEPVNQKSIKSIKLTPNIDESIIKIATEVPNFDYGDLVEVSIYDGSKQIAQTKFAAGQELEVPIENAKLWSPKSPFLYDATIKLISDGEVTDEMKTYFGMRKISKKRDENGIVRMQLNNKDYFHFGPLDQGWWPGGLYTAPTDEALKYDIEKTKEFGYNMIRKHVKVEPARWYTHADRMGVLVWQDMPNGDKDSGWQGHNFATESESQRTRASEEIFKKEWKGIMDYLHNYTSIVVWVPFNEAWGQFNTREITEWTKYYDPTRLVNSASGGNHFQGVGDIMDLHNYPDPKLYLYDADRINVLGEYGGIGLPLEGHLWKTDNNWGYIKFKNKKEVTDKYIEYAEKLKKLVKTGFSGAVYTQITDVEGEVNGLMTYDRKKDKVNVEKVRRINQEVIEAIHE